ncbi:cardiolipin synthase [Bradyrhizobium yuanmingense]|uniref:phospholipase D-like domain-containing protein n=1 Tax=Bradyrhizobium yuanmingense TaxID=108015 RepID=UPI0035158BDA
MSLIRVAIPVLQGRRKFHFDKGRPWTVLEHLLLCELDRGPTSVHALRERACIPERVIIEALIRLMRAGWVEMMQSPAAVHFQITPEGQVVKEYDQLPMAPRRLSRNMTFVIDQITGTLFRSRDLPFVHEHVVDKREEQGEPIVRIDRPARQLIEEVRPLVDALFQSDEKFVGIDPYGSRLSKRWALVPVRDGQPEGLSPRTPTRLVEEIKRAAAGMSSKAAGAPQRTYASVALPGPENPQVTPPVRKISFTTNDLITGGADHETALKGAIGRARHRLLIHSTFVSAPRFAALLPDLRKAIALGVKIDILWGQDKNTDERRSTAKVVQQLRAELKSEGLEGLTLQPFSTGSHAKIVLADDGTPNKMIALVGSCNWLYSGFSSFEVSVRLRDNQLVADVIDQVAELSRGGNGHWTNLTSELVAQAVNLRSQKPSSEGKASVSVLLGPSHAELVREARNRADRTLVIASHRFAGAANNLILPPVFAASKRARDLDVRLFYGEDSGAITATDIARMTNEAAKVGVRIRPVYRPRLHAKFLGWDDDVVVITSQNWLSADSTDDNPRQEIGICIRSPGVGRILLERFEAATVTASAS